MAIDTRSADLKARGLITYEASGFREWCVSAALAWGSRNSAALSRKPEPARTSHSQITRTSHPSSWSRAWFSASRATFRYSFGNQYSRLIWTVGGFCIQGVRMLMQKVTVQENDLPSCREPSR